MHQPPFSYGKARIPLSEYELESPLITANGTPASELGDVLLRIFFQQPGRSYELTALADELFLDPQHLLTLLRQLVVFNLIDEEAGKELRFQKARQPWNREFFHRVETEMCRLFQAQRAA